MYSKGRKLGMNIAGKLKKKLGDSDDKEQQVTFVSLSASFTKYVAYYVQRRQFF